MLGKLMDDKCETQIIKSTFCVRTNWEGNCART